AGREVAPEAGVLDDHRAAGGEVGRAALAEPAAPQPDVLVLCDAELAARELDERAVGVEVGAEAETRPNPPAVVFEHAAIRIAEARERKLERHVRARGQVE